jgi:hypothetical protein
MKFYQAGEDRVEPRKIMILGRPGSGKTRLAGTFPKPFYIDIDKGAKTALKGKQSPNRVQLDMSAGTRKEVKAILGKLSQRKPDENGIITYEVGGEHEIEIGTVVIDTLSALQEACQIYEVMRGARTMDYDKYNQLLSLMQELVPEWQNLPVHIVVNCHSKKRDVEGERFDEVKPNLTGSIRDLLPKWFDLILHMMVGRDGKRYVVTDEVVISGVKYLAKDRHDELAHLLEGSEKYFKLEDLDGYPDSRIADVITGDGHVSEE